MKRGILFVATLFAVLTSYAQGEMDALRFSREDLTGTARGMAMGGAFGALGGDITGVAINPAGIGVYRSSEVVTTLNFENVSSKTDYTENKFKFNFDNVAYMAYYPSGNDQFLSFNFGFAYNRLKNFDRQYQTSGRALPGSMTDYMADQANVTGVYEGDMGMESPTDRWPFDNGQPWLPTLGYNAYLINPPGSVEDFYTSYLKEGDLVDNNLYVSETGAMSSYDFTFGTNISNILSLGLTLSVTDIQYNMYSSYSESFYNGGLFDLENWMETTGTGFNLKVGAILKPTDFLRLGVAYHSPTWYDMTDVYSADIAHERLYTTGALTPTSIETEGIFRPEDYRPGILYTGDHASDYKLQTPYKWVFSAAGIIGTKAIVSVDYQIEDYRGMDFGSPDGEHIDYSVDNSVNDRHYKSASTIKAGIECRITPQFSIRGGYAWMQTPLTDDFKAGTGTPGNEASVAGSVSQYILEGDVSYYTCGLGYKFTPNFYMDIAAVFRQQKDELFAYPNVVSYGVQSKGTPMTTDTFKGLLTLGCKF